MTDIISDLPLAVRHFLQYCRVECRLSHNTLENYQRDLRRFCNHLREEGLELERVKAEDLGSYLGRLAAEGLEAASRARALVTLRMLYRFCSQEKIVTEDPGLYLEGPKLWRHLPEFLSSDEVARLLNSENSDQPVSIRNRALLELLYATGARASELCDCEASWYHPEEERIRLRGKRGKERFVPLGLPAQDALAEYLNRVRPVWAHRSNSSKLLLTRSGNPIDRTTIWRVVKTAALKAGIGKRLYPHLLRHSFATHMLQGGANLRVVQELLGHSDIATTEIYTHIGDDRLRESYHNFHPGRESPL